MDKSLISIIIPVYNVEKYLKRCLDSVISQTYNNLEIILVDDGAKDNSGIICDEYAKQDNRIRVIHRPNGGVSAARNAGLNVVTGNYVCFIDADDVVSNDYVSYLYKLLIRYDADVAVCDFRKVEVYNLEKNMNFLNKGGNLKLEYDRLSAIKDLLYKRNLTGYSCVKMFKKSVISDIRFNENLQVAEDFDFVFGVFQNCKKIVFSNKIMYLYVQNPNSCMHGLDWNKYEKAWDYQWNQLERIKENYPELKNSFETYLLVGGLSFYAHSQKWDNSKQFKDKIINNLASICNDVARNKDGKRIHRILGGMCCISTTITCYIMKIYYIIQLIFNIQLEKPI